MDEDVISIRNDKGNKSVIVSSNDIESLSLNDNNSYYRILDLISSSGYDINKTTVHQESSVEELINLLKILIQQQDEIEKLNMNILQLKEKILTVDVTNAKELELKKSTLEIFSNHILSVLNNLETLVTNLKKPFMGDYILIDPQNQENLLDIFNGSVKDISLLKENINNALWLNHVNDFQNELELMLNKFPAIIATYNKYYNSLIKLDETLQQLLQLDISSNI